MTTYKELADRLDRSTRHDAYMHKLIEEAVAVLRSLDAQPVAEVSVMGSYHGKPILGCVLSNDSMQVGDKLFAAPVAAQPTEPKQSQFFCGVDFADGVLAVSVMRRRPDDVAELIHSEQIEVAAQLQQAKPPTHVCGLQGFGALGDECPACAQPAKPLSEEGWKPISTAPKDRTVLLYGAKRLYMCVGMHDSRNGWVTDTPSEWASMYPPTHWMPLPPPPPPKD